jgi:hypothetical protein
MSLVDATGKLIGPFFPAIPEQGGVSFVLIKINGAWVELQVQDLTVGFTSAQFPLYYAYQSTDCTGTAYLFVTTPFNPNNIGPIIGSAVTIPPATTPSIYYAGTPTSLLTIKSTLNTEISGCSALSNPNGEMAFVGPPQSVPVSSLGFTLSFSIQ